MAERKWDVTKFDSPNPKDDKVRVWLASQMKPNRQWLLAYADDGVIWGKLTADQQLMTSNDIAPKISPELRWETLQQAYIFGEQGEVRLWREGDDWHARLVIGDADETDTINEHHILWGTKTIQNKNQVKDGFTQVQEGQQGMNHVAPLVVTDDGLRERKLKLLVRHLIEYDADSGEARITLSRLVNIEVSK